MITLNSYEVKVLSHLFQRPEDAKVSASQIKRSTKLGLFKVRRALSSLERKKLVVALERTRTRPYMLTERGRAIAWLATMNNKQIIELFRSQIR